MGAATQSYDRKCVTQDSRWEWLHSRSDALDQQSMSDSDSKSGDQCQVQIVLNILIVIK